MYCFDKTRCSDDLFFGANLNTVLAFRSRATFLLVALNDDRIEETVSFKMSQDFLRQVLITTFPSAHEADRCSTVRMHMYSV